MFSQKGIFLQFQNDYLVQSSNVNRINSINDGGSKKLKLINKSSCSRRGSNSQPSHCQAVTAYKYDALTDCATGAMINGENSRNDYKLYKPDSEEMSEFCFARLIKGPLRYNLQGTQNRYCIRP